MSNVAVIFAGGTGQRMNTRTRPKQFLELHGKPIIVYTMEAFDQHSEIDGIIVVMLESWIGYTQELVRRFGIRKIKKKRFPIPRRKSFRQRIKRTSKNT